MAEGVGAAAYGLETLLEGAVALAKGIYHPTLPLKARLQTLEGADVSRASHSLSVVKGRAYIFGGKAGEVLADNAMHVIILPSSGVESIDYKKIDATDDAPPPRFGHSAAVIDDQIYVFGGVDAGGEMLDEAGCVWAYDTTINTWSKLKVLSNAQHPSPRAQHATTASEQPQPPQQRTDYGTLPQLPPDPATVVPEPLPSNTYGTFIIQGGHGPGDVRLSDVWSFDIASRSWSQLPTPPPPVSGSPSLAIIGLRLFTFAIGQISHLDLTPSATPEKGGFGRSILTPQGPWSSFPPSASGPDNRYPGERTACCLIPVTTGQGRNYLTLFGGQTSNGSVAQDIWAYQLKPEDMTAASLKDAARRAIRKETNECRWDEVKYYDADGVLIQERQAGRGIGIRRGLAAARGTEVDGASFVLWGGVDEHGKSRSDGLMVTVER